MNAPIFPPQYKIVADGNIVTNGYTIEDPAAIGPPHWFSIKVAVRQGSSQGWTADAGEALQFGRRQDAEDFAARYLPGMAVKIAGRNGS